MSDRAGLDDALVAAAQEMREAHAALDRARARRDLALVGYVRDGMTTPAVSVRARRVLLEAGLDEHGIRLVGVSAPTVAQAVKVAKAAAAATVELAGD
jgi:endonuclease YncB( thermonuclease family)